MIKIRNKTTIILISLVVILVLMGGFFGYKYWQSIQNDPKQQTKELLEHVSSIAHTPSETPTIATITDTSKLSRHPKTTPTSHSPGRIV